MWISLKASCGLGSLVIPGHKIHSKGCAKLTFLCGHRCTRNTGGWRQREVGTFISRTCCKHKRRSPYGWPALCYQEDRADTLFHTCPLCCPGVCCTNVDPTIGVAGVLPFPRVGDTEALPWAGAVPPRRSLVGSLGLHSILPPADVGPWKHCFPGPPFAVSMVIANDITDTESIAEL